MKKAGILNWMVNFINMILRNVRCFIRKATSADMKLCTIVLMEKARTICVCRKYLCRPNSCTGCMMGAMEQELAPIPGETMSLADIDRTLDELEKQFNSLLAEASAAGGTEDYAERFRMISNTMADLKEHKARIKQVHQENELLNQRLKAASMAMSAYSAELTEWDQSVVYQLVEKVTALAKDKIRVTFRDGTEVEQEIEQLDWRNAS